MHRNTDLCVDIKTFLHTSRIATVGEKYKGELTRDAEDHFTFVENMPRTSASQSRSPIVYHGNYITVTRRQDGTFRLNFKQVVIDEGCPVHKVAMSVSSEIVEALEGLVGG